MGKILLYLQKTLGGTIIMYYQTLRKAIKEKGLAQSQVAMQCNIHPCNFSKAILGRTEFFVGYQKKISEYFGKSVDELFPADEIPDFWKREEKGEESYV